MSEIEVILNSFDASLHAPVLKRSALLKKSHRLKFVQLLGWSLDKIDIWSDIMQSFDLLSAPVFQTMLEHCDVCHDDRNKVELLCLHRWALCEFVVSVLSCNDAVLLNNFLRFSNKLSSNSSFKRKLMEVYVSNKFKPSFEQLWNMALELENSRCCSSCTIRKKYDEDFDLRFDHCAQPKCDNTQEWRSDGNCGFVLQRPCNSTNPIIACFKISFAVRYYEYEYVDLLNMCPPCLDLLARLISDTVCNHDDGLPPGDTHLLFSDRKYMISSNRRKEKEISDWSINSLRSIRYLNRLRSGLQEFILESKRLLVLNNREMDHIAADECRREGERNAALKHENMIGTAMTADPHWQANERKERHRISRLHMIKSNLLRDIDGYAVDEKLPASSRRIDSNNCMPRIFLDNNIPKTVQGSSTLFGYRYQLVVPSFEEELNQSRSTATAIDSRIIGKKNMETEAIRKKLASEREFHISASMKLQSSIDMSHYEAHQEQEMEMRQRWVTNSEITASWYARKELEREDVERRIMMREEELKKNYDAAVREEKTRQRHLMEMRDEEGKQTLTDGFWGFQIKAMKEYEARKRLYDEYQRNVKYKHGMMKRFGLVK